jgi:hypothetical protein
MAAAGRLVAPRHWLSSVPFKATLAFAHLSGDQAEAEMREAWTRGYDAGTFGRTQRWLEAHRKPFDAQVMFLVARLIFRGIYFQQGSAWSWIRALAANAPTLARIVVRRVLSREPSAAPIPAPAAVRSTGA